MHQTLLPEEKVLEILRNVGAIITDSHIVYTSGKHGSAYVNKDAVYPHTLVTSRLCQAIAFEVICLHCDIQVVIAPAVGGVILSQWTAFHLNTMTEKPVLGVYAEKSPDGEEFVIRRGYDKLVAGKNVLVVEDILNTGGSAKKVVEAVRRIGGTVEALAVLCNRGGVTIGDIGDPPEMFSLCNINMDAWDEAECPLCANKVPINTQVGKGREFLARQQK